MWPPFSFIADDLTMKAVGAMPTAGLAAVSSLQQIMFGENIEPVLDVVIDAFDEGVAGSRFHRPVLLSRHWKPMPIPGALG